MLLIALLVASGPVYEAESRPMALYHYIFLYRVLPFFSRLWFPYRMVSLALFAAIIGMGFLMERFRGRWRWLVLFWVGLNLAEQARYLVVPLLSQPWHYPKMYERMSEHEGAIVELPIGMVRESILWQSVHKKPMFGGMGENLPLLIPKQHRLRLRAPLYTYLRKIVMDPTRKRSKPMLNRALREGFRFIVVDMRLVNGLYLRYPEEKREKRKEQLVEKLKNLLGDIWLVEGPYRVWDLHNQAPSTEVLEYTPSGIGMQRSRLEQKLFELNRLD